MARTPRATTMTPAASCKRLLMLDDEELPGRHHGGHFQRSGKNCPSHTGSCDSVVLSFTEGLVAAATAALLCYPSGTKSARLLKLEPSALHFTPTYPSQPTLPTPLRVGAFPSKYLLHQRQCIPGCRHKNQRQSSHYLPFPPNRAPPQHQAATLVCQVPLSSHRPTGPYPPKRPQKDGFPPPTDYAAQLSEPPLTNREAHPAASGPLSLRGSKPLQDFSSTPAQQSVPSSLAQPDPRSPDPQIHSRATPSPIPTASKPDASLTCLPEGRSLSQPCQECSDEGLFWSRELTEFYNPTLEVLNSCHARV